MRTASRLVVRNSCKDFCGYVVAFSFCAFLWIFVPLSIEGVHMVRSTRTAASNDGKALGQLDSWYDGPESWTPGADEFLRNHLSMYYTFSVVNYGAFVFVNVIAWIRYFSLRNWTYAARLMAFQVIALVVNMGLVWRPTPDGAIQEESNIVYYLAAPIVTYADRYVSPTPNTALVTPTTLHNACHAPFLCHAPHLSFFLCHTQRLFCSLYLSPSFISFRLAWYWTLIIDWWKHGGFFCCCASREEIHDTQVTKTRLRYVMAFLLLGQSILYPVVTRQMYTDALICNGFMAYSVYTFIEWVWVLTQDPHLAAKFDSNTSTESQALIVMRHMHDDDDSAVFTIGGDTDDSFDMDAEPHVQGAFDAHHMEVHMDD